MLSREAGGGRREPSDAPKRRPRPPPPPPAPPPPPPPPRPILQPYNCDLEVRLTHVRLSYAYTDVSPHCDPCALCTGHWGVSPTAAIRLGKSKRGIWLGLGVSAVSAICLRRRDVHQRDGCSRALALVVVSKYVSTYY